MSGKQAANQFYVKTSKKVLGPFTRAQLETLRDRGQLKPEFSISSDRRKWQPVDEFEWEPAYELSAAADSGGEEWYFSRDGHGTGPMTKVALLNAFQHGQLNADDLIWTEGFAEWRSYRDVFMSGQQSGPPPLPPAPSFSPQYQAAPQPESSEKYCTSCGQRMALHLEHCPWCQAPQHGSRVPNPMYTGGRPVQDRKDKTTAGILALFIGGLGVHHFYLGNIGMGILYVLFCWTFIPAIISFIEGIIFLTMSDERFEIRYNS